MPDPTELPTWLTVTPGAAGWRPERAWDLAAPHAPRDLAVAPGGATVAVVDAEGAVFLHDLHGMAAARPVGGEEARSVAWLPDGRLLVGTEHGGRVHVVAGATVRASWEVAAAAGDVGGPYHAPSYVRRIRLDAAGAVAAIEVGFTDFGAETWSTALALVTWDVATGAAIAARREADGPGWDAFAAAHPAAPTPPSGTRLGAVAPDGRHAAVAHDVGTDGTRTRWEVVAVASGAVALHLASRADAWERGIARVAFGPGGLLVVATREGRLVAGPLEPVSGAEPVLGGRAAEAPTGLAPALAAGEGHGPRRGGKKARKAAREG